MKRIEIDHDGQRTWAYVEKVSSTLWLHWQGETYAFEDERRRKSKSQGGADDPTQIVAPMPGKILKLNVAAGDTAEAGQTLVVMEAMKMEYSLKAKANAKVTAVNTSVGEQVKASATLIELEPSDES